jgi:hypothetical protein
MTLTEFLEQEISKDEEVARTAAGWDRTGRERVPGVWVRSGVNSVESVRGLVVYGDGPAPDDAEVEHIARHDPARVLAECEAKRRIVASAGTMERYGDEMEILALVALPYASRPGYRNEWRP